MKNIAAAFIAAKQEFAPALKTSNNPAFRSKYADLGNCIDAVNDALLKHGIAMFQKTLPDERGVTVVTVLLHESGESIESGPLHVPAAKQDPQGYGSALTYARRYSLMAACGIAPEDDDGNAASGSRAPTQQGAAPSLVAQARAIAAKGTDALRAYWDDIGKEKRKALAGELANLQKIAEQAEKEAA